MKNALYFGLALIIASPCGAQKQQQQQPPDLDVQLLKSAGIEPVGPTLLKYFKDRTGKMADPQQVAGLIRQLGDDTFQVRDKAYHDLIKLGPSSLSGLKLAQNDPDLEVRLRIDEIRKTVIAKVDPAVQAAASRVLAAARPDGTAEVLINYLPFAPDQVVADEISATLKAVAIRDGKADPALVKALNDALPVKRIAALQALVTDKEQLPIIRNMVQDTNPVVRLHAAMTLVKAKEKEALPVLIDMLGVLNADQLWQAEELLIRLAGADAPYVSLGNSEESRKKCRDAWRGWLTKHSDKLDMAKVDQAQALLGYTLIVQQTLNRGRNAPATGEVMELDNEKRPRWKFPLTTYPVDAHVIHHDRVLVAEYYGGRVTERDFKGNLLWEQTLTGSPVSVQGLANDNVFVHMKNRLVEYDRRHKEVFSLNVVNDDIYRAKKLRNGEVVFITTSGQLTRMDANQQVLKSFRVCTLPMLYGSIDILPNGGVLVPDFHQNRVIEYDRDGKFVNQLEVLYPQSVMRLPNGHTLVSSQSSRRVVELDSRGKEVWSYNGDTIFNSRKR